MIAYGKGYEAARDNLTLPNFTTSLREGPTLIGFYNQMKQEYASARWLYYAGLHTTRPHFSDREVLLFNTLDYPSYGLSVEQIKASFRVAYSLLDKIAFFLNDYLELGVAANQVYFRKIWYLNDGKELRPPLVESANRSLLGLFWLSKDLFDDKLKKVTEPDARALHEMRNHLEHKYLKVHEHLVAGTTLHNPDDPWSDRLAYPIARADLEAKTLRVLMLARVALIYLPLAMHREERRRQPKKGAKLSMPMVLDAWEDEWKR